MRSERTLVSYGASGVRREWTVTRFVAGLALLSSACGMVAGLDDKAPRAHEAASGRGGTGGTSGGSAGTGGTSGEAGAGETGGEGGAAGSARGGSAGTGAGTGATSGRGGSGASSGRGGSAGTGTAGSGGTGGNTAEDCDEELPRTIDADLTVGPGCVRVSRTTVTTATLTIAPGTTVLMEAGAALDTDTQGVLRAVGSATEPILFTSSAAQPAPGDWQCVRLDGTRPGTELRHATFEFGGAPCEVTSADEEGMLQLFATTDRVSDSTFRNSASHGVLIRRESDVAIFQDNAFADNGAASVNVGAPQLLVLGTGLTFAQDTDRIHVDTTFSLMTSGTWRAQPVPFRLASTLEVGGADVTIAAGTTIELTSGSIDVFQSTLTVEGTEDEPVTFTSALTPPAAGDWGCITFSASTGSFEYAVLEYAGSGVRCSGGEYQTALRVPEGTTIANSTFRNVAGTAILSTDCQLDEWCENSFESVETGPLACGNGQVPTACP